MDHFFPDGIWEEILEKSLLSYKDVCNFGAVCQSFLTISRKNRIWRKKFKERWSVTSEFYTPSCWLQTYKERQECVTFVSNILNSISYSYLNRETIHVPYSVFVKQLLNDRCEYWNFFVIDELRTIVNDKDRTTNLTQKFYGVQALKCLVRKSLSSQVTNWLASEPMLMETGAFLFEQWFRPEKQMIFAEFQEILENIAAQTKAKLKETNRTHPIYYLDQTIRKEELKSSLWTNSECRQILDVLRHLFMNELGYTGDTVSDENHQLERSCINLVLSTRHGRPITFCILFHAVALRLGVVCELVNLPGRFLLRFLEHPELSDHEQYTYLNVWDGCRWMTENQVWILLRDLTGNMEKDRTILTPVTPDKVVLRMVNNIHYFALEGDPHHRDMTLLCSALELSTILQPGDMKLRLSLARLYLDYFNTNADLANELLQDGPTTSAQSAGCPFITQFMASREMAKNRLVKLGIEGPEMILATFSKMGLWNIYFSQIIDVLILSLNRYWALVKPFKYREIWHRPSTLIICLCVQWFVPLLTIIPMFLPHCRSKFHNETFHPIFKDDNPLKFKCRTDSENSEVKHSVGQIMRHKKYGYTCVIYGWDPHCAATHQWQSAMGVHTLERKGKQPFYNVLVNDGSNRYAAEDNMIFEPNPIEIDHNEIGKYFDQFCVNYYKMNPAKQQEYPEDAAFSLDYVQRMYDDS